MVHKKITVDFVGFKYKGNAVFMQRRLSKWFFISQIRGTISQGKITAAKKAAAARQQEETKKKAMEAAARKREREEKTNRGDSEEKFHESPIP